jgi:hypothetical protein
MAGTVLLLAWFSIGDSDAVPLLGRLDGNTPSIICGLAGSLIAAGAATLSPAGKRPLIGASITGVIVAVGLLWPAPEAGSSNEYLSIMVSTASGIVMAVSALIALVLIISTGKNARTAGT